MLSKLSFEKPDISVSGVYTLSFMKNIGNCDSKPVLNFKVNSSSFNITFLKSILLFISLKLFSKLNKMFSNLIFLEDNDLFFSLSNKLDPKPICLPPLR